MSTQREKRSIGKHACERCRKSKTRCLLDTFDAHGKCRKCFFSNLECTWKEISTKRRRLRTDTRVSELEKQLKNFESVLTNLGHKTLSEADEAHYDSRTDQASSSGPGVSTFGNVPVDEDDSARKLSHSLPNQRDLNDTSLLLTSHQQPAQNDPLISLLIGENLSKDRQIQLIQDFYDLLLAWYPIICSVPKETLESLPTSKPLLTAAIITAASSVSEPRLFENLHTKLTRIISEQVLVQGQKNLEIVQAVLICGVWHHPPSKLENLTFQLCNMAATMSLELGLGGRSSWHTNHRVVAGLKADSSSTALEVFRTMFSVYLTCSRVAISLRRQRMITFSPGTDPALETFAEHATTTNDKRLIAWVKLQLIAEDIERMKTNIESQTESIFTDKEAVKNDLSMFSNRLSDWERMTKEPVLNETLRIDFCFCRGKLHELAIYADYNIEDLAVPFLSPAKPLMDHTTGTNDLNPTYVRALLSFINDCHAILDVVLTTDVTTLRCCPLLTHLRIPYAFKALAMVRKALESPNKSNISKVVDEETLRFKYYVVALSKHIEAASDQGLYSGPSTALKIRDLVMKMRPSTGRSLLESMTQSKDSLPVQEQLRDDARPSEENEGTSISFGVDAMVSSQDLTLDQPEESFLFDDLDLLSFDFGPAFVDWPM